MFTSSRKSGKELTNLNKDLIINISTFLRPKDGCVFSSICKFSVFALIDVKAITAARRNRRSYVDSATKNLEPLIHLALRGINNYLENDAEKPDLPIDYGGYSFTNPSINYSKGYRRAECFKDILSDEQNTPLECLFALNVLLQERNGSKLKSNVNHELFCGLLPLGRAWDNLLRSRLDSHVNSQFGHVFALMRDALLETIHDEKNGPMPDGGYEIDVERGFTQNHFRRVIDSKYKRDNRCAVS